jgi:hypothetical protein
MELTDTNKPCGLTIFFLKNSHFITLTQKTCSIVIVFIYSGKLDFFGGQSEKDTPVLIPNTEVKLLSADGTARETWWESRSPPNFF